MFAKTRCLSYMNKQESDILNTLLLEPYINQKILADICGHSLGIVNRSMKSLIKDGYLDELIRPTEKAIQDIPDWCIRFFRCRRLGGIRSLHSTGLQFNCLQLLSSEAFTLNIEYCSIVKDSAQGTQ